MAKKILLIILTFIVMAGVAYGVYYWLKKTERYQPKQDAISRKLPEDVSRVRLNLPASLSDLMVSPEKGLGGLGIDTDDPVKSDYTWMDVKSGTEIKSLGAGKIEKINQVNDNEYEIIINYSSGLWGRHLKIKEPLVKVNDLVTEGQAVGKGLPGSQDGSDLAAFSIADENLKAGIKSSFSPGFLVAPLDYLKPDVKMLFLKKYSPASENF